MPRPPPAIGDATRAQCPVSSSDSTWKIDLHTSQAVGVLIIQDKANHHTHGAPALRDHSRSPARPVSLARSCWTRY